MFRRIVYDQNLSPAILTALLQIGEKNPDLFFENNDISTVIKQLKGDATSTVCLVRIQNQEIVIKRVNTRSVWEGVRRAFAVSRAARNWTNVKKLRSVGVRTFDPVMMIENRFGIFKGRSYLLMSFVKGVDAFQFFSHNRKPECWIPVADSIIQLILKLEQKRVSHRDLNLSNLIINEGQPFLIDLDAMRGHRGCAQRERQRFLENLEVITHIAPDVKEYFTNKLLFSERRKETNVAIT